MVTLTSFQVPPQDFYHVVHFHIMYNLDFLQSDVAMQVGLPHCAPSTKSKAISNFKNHEKIDEKTSWQINSVLENIGIKLLRFEFLILIKNNEYPVLNT